MIDVNKITPEVVKKAVSHLNTGKSDPTFLFSSECLINAPDILYEHLANVYKIFLIHGHVSLVLLLSTLVPLIKDRPSLADKSTPISPFSLSKISVGIGPSSPQTSPSPISASAICDNGAKSPDAPNEPIRGTTGITPLFR